MNNCTLIRVFCLEHECQIDLENLENGMDWSNIFDHCSLVLCIFLSAFLPSQSNFLPTAQASSSSLDSNLGVLAVPEPPMGNSRALPIFSYFIIQNFQLILVKCINCKLACLFWYRHFSQNHKISTTTHGTILGKRCSIGSLSNRLVRMNSNLS